MQSDSVCPSCNFPILQDWFFCPNCGKNLKEKPLSTTLLRQVFIYLVSFFLAPFGLAWAYKYLRQKNAAAKRIGVAVIIITIIAIAVTFKIASSFFASFYAVPGLTDLYR